MERQEQKENRLNKLEALRRKRVQVYGGAFPKAETLHTLVDEYKDALAVKTAGRLSAKRGHGALTFADLRDASGKIQLSVKRDRLGDELYQLFLNLDIGDIIGVAGTLFKTRTGEVTLQVDELTLLSKSLRPLPEKWHGLKQVEIRYRKRYLDLIANEETRKVFLQRGRLISSIRQTLEARDFIEVETPMMHVIPGGAAGEPFVTHHKALDADLYLRLAPELYLKKLLVGGLERVYELNRSFRNEGISTQHNPEFTMLEVYAAYKDYAFMMQLVQELICEAAKGLLGSLEFEFRGQRIDLTPPWDEVSFSQKMEEIGLTPDASLERIESVLKERGLKVKGLARSQILHLVEQLFEPKTKAKPLFVTDYWSQLSPLAKSKANEPTVAERFELFVAGMEVANAYSELNDPIEQRRRFESQLEYAQGSQLTAQGQGKKTSLQPTCPKRNRGGASSLERKIDESFLEALEYGMPPAGGLGVGIDRLAMLLFDQASIKDVILFPLLKSENH